MEFREGGVIGDEGKVGEGSEGKVFKVKIVFCYRCSCLDT